MISKKFKEGDKVIHKEIDGSRGTVVAKPKDFRFTSFGNKILVFVAWDFNDACYVSGDTLSAFEENLELIKGSDKTSASIEAKK